MIDEGLTVEPPVSPFARKPVSFFGGGWRKNLGKDEKGKRREETRRQGRASSSIEHLQCNRGTPQRCNTTYMTESDLLYEL
jgi:hypothetical protein